MSAATQSASRKRQGKLGQFFTGAHVSEFMASLFDSLPETVRLLDAGAGAGALTTAFASHMCAARSDVRAIDATLYELDPLLQQTLQASMEECQRCCREAGLRFSLTIRATDFIRESAERFGRDLFQEASPAFDAAIVNPPYRKISTASAERAALHSVGIETSNLYAGFIALIQRLLVAGGQLVAITPRSFCNGPYFRPFREDFLDNMELRRLHVFESRQAAFRNDQVLQENIIFHAVKGRIRPRELLISSSSGEPGDTIDETVLPFAEIVRPDDSERFIHIPSAAGHATAKETLDGLHTSLTALGVSVSTGRVVDFRLRASIRPEPEAGAVPLIYPCHFRNGRVYWPKVGSRKPNAIIDDDETRQWLVPSGLYLLTKRFTAKEERRRIVACLFDPLDVPSERVGFENHLNYFHSGGQGLNRTLALGLFTFLNSTIVDQYFRRFSGHTQVNATDLRKLAYPDRQTLDAIGSEVDTVDLPQAKIDQLVSRHLHA